MTVRPLHLLTINHGSSSLKYGLYQSDGDSTRELATASIEASGADLPVGAIREMISSNGGTLDAIGHRIVHGGPALRLHCIITPAVLAQLDAASAFAPLHAAPALAAVRSAQQCFPGVPEVACFDTEFHSTLPDVARVLPVSQALQAEGIERYGFHGLSCESIVRQLGRDLPSRLVIAHLGNGSSITAVAGGKSVDTSMGLTPSGGVVMGTRSGDLDPGLLIYLLRNSGYDADQLEQLIDHQSGLLGISGLSSDMRVLHAAAGNDAARLAVAIFAMSVRKEVAAMMSVLGGADALVFTGGIGEHDAVVRAMICEGLGWAGITIDAGANQRSDRAIHASGAACRVHVLPSREDEEIARHAGELLAPTATG